MHALVMMPLRLVIPYTAGVMRGATMRRTIYILIATWLVLAGALTTGCGSAVVTSGSAVTPVPSVSPNPSPNPVPLASANLLFSSGFEGTTALLPPSGFYGTGAWQDFVGLDSITGFTWPPNIWGGGPTHFQMIADTTVDATTIDNYMFNQIQTVTGHDGSPTQALYQQISQSGCCGTGPQGGSPTQDPFMIQPVGETSDLYISYWLKYQPDLAQKMTNPNWRVVFEWKTAGDY